MSVINGFMKSINKNILNNYLIFSALIATLLGLFNSVLMQYNVIIIPNIRPCAYETNAFLMLYEYARMCVYYMGILRIFAAFKGSVFEYSKTFRYILVIGVTISGVGHWAMFGLLGKGIAKEYKNNKYWCQYAIHLPVAILTWILDISLNIFLLILFIKPLITLIKRSDHTDSCYVIIY